MPTAPCLLEVGCDYFMLRVRIECCALEGPRQMIIPRPFVSGQYTFTLGVTNPNLPGPIPMAANDIQVTPPGVDNGILFSHAAQALQGHIQRNPLGESPKIQ